MEQLGEEKERLKDRVLEEGGWETAAAGSGQRPSTTTHWMSRMIKQLFQ